MGARARSRASTLAIATCSASAATCSPRRPTASTSSSSSMATARRSVRVSSSSRSGDMIREVRTFDDGREFRVAVTSGLRPLPAWKQEADVCFAQIGFDLDALVPLARRVDVRGQVCMRV